eukprot:3366660-Pyramimonas_sp.AAC.1
MRRARTSTNPRRINDAAVDHPSKFPLRASLRSVIVIVGSAPFGQGRLRVATIVPKHVSWDFNATNQRDNFALT